MVLLSLFSLYLPLFNNREHGVTFVSRHVIHIHVVILSRILQLINNNRYFGYNHIIRDPCVYISMRKNIVKTLQEKLNNLK